MTDDGKSPAIGAIGENVRRNVEELRQARKLGTPALSARLRDLGRPILPSVLHRLGQGTRRTDCDDLVALSVALGVNPSALLFDRHAAAGDAIPLTPASSQRADLVWEWADGRAPLPDAPIGENDVVRRSLADEIDFVTYARPDLARRRSHPSVLAAEQLIGSLMAALASAGGDAQETHVRRALRRVELEVDELFAKEDAD